MNRIEFFPLKSFVDERGKILHYLKKDCPYFNDFGESYFSWVNPSYIKGWYKHKKYTCYLTSPTMNLKVVVYDGRHEEITTFSITKDSYGLIKIPSDVWYSFASMDEKTALVANTLNELYDPNEVEKLPMDTKKIPYRWG